MTTNTFNTIKDAPGIIARTAAMTFADNLHFVKSIAKADESDYKGKNGYSAGNTVYISKPARFTVQRGDLDISTTKQNITEEKVPLVLDDTFSIGVELNSLEFATEIQLKEFNERFTKPAAAALAHNVESFYISQAINETANSVGTPGANVFDTQTVLAARTKLNKFLCPKDDMRTLLMESNSSAAAVNANKGLFNSQEELAKTYKSGAIGKAHGFNWVESEMLPTHLNGNDVAFEVRTAVAVEGQKTLVVEGLATTTGTVKAGTVFTIATVNAVHPITKEDLGFLKQWVVAADATADASGYATLTLTEGFYTADSDGLQNVTAFPADGDTITPLGAASTAYQQNLAYHKEAFRFVSVPLIMPKNAEMAVQENYKGFSIALVRYFDGDTRTMSTRLDFLGAMAAVRPEWSCRLWA
jgi:hypothetical protein